MHKKMISRIAVVTTTALFMGMTPMTAFATGKAPVISEDFDAEEEIRTSVEPETEETEESEAWDALTPDGNLTLVDDYGDPEKGGKQFITVVTKAGNYFYIVIDRDDNGSENVHFMNLVDESDLLSLMDETEAQEYLDEKEAEEEARLESERLEAERLEQERLEAERKAAESEKDETEESASKTDEGDGSKLILPKLKLADPKIKLTCVAMLVAGFGLAGFLFAKLTKGKKNTKKAAEDPDAEYEENYLDTLQEEKEEEN